jgi:hypothetical protein
MWSVDVCVPFPRPGNAGNRGYTHGGPESGCVGDVIHQQYVHNISMISPLYLHNKPPILAQLFVTLHLMTLWIVEPTTARIHMTNKPEVPTKDRGKKHRSFPTSTSGTLRIERFPMDSDNPQID